MNPYSNDVSFSFLNVSRYFSLYFHMFGFLSLQRSYPSPETLVNIWSYFVTQFKLY